MKKVTIVKIKVFKNSNGNGYVKMFILENIKETKNCLEELKSILIESQAITNEANEHKQDIINLKNGMYHVYSGEFYYTITIEEN